MTTDDLTERIRRARSVPAEWARLREGESTREQIERHQRRMDEQTAALVAAEVRAAKAEALGGLSAHISEVVDNAKPWQVFTEHVLHEAGVCDYLDRAAAEYEAGDSNEHR